MPSLRLDMTLGLAICRTVKLQAITFGRTFARLSKTLGTWSDIIMSAASWRTPVSAGSLKDLNGGTNLRKLSRSSISRFETRGRDGRRILFNIFTRRWMLIVNTISLFIRGSSVIHSSSRLVSGFVVCRIFGQRTFCRNRSRGLRNTSRGHKCINAGSSSIVPIPIFDVGIIGLGLIQG